MVHTGEPELHKQSWKAGQSSPLAHDLEASCEEQVPEMQSRPIWQADGVPHAEATGAEKATLQVPQLTRLEPDRHVETLAHF